MGVTKNFFQEGQKIFCLLRYTYNIFENSPDKWFWSAVDGQSHKDCKDAEEANNFNLKYSKREYFSIKMIYFK